MEEVITKITNVLESSKIFTVKSIEDINHKPHPYCITEKHITGRYMTLDSNTIQLLEKESAGKIGCGMYVSPDGSYTNGRKSGYTKCTIPFEQHTSDKVCFLSLLRNTTEEEVRAELLKIQDILSENKVDGIAFVETEEKYRIA